MAEGGQRPNLPFSIENILRDDFPSPSRIRRRPYIVPNNVTTYSKSALPCQGCLTVRFGPPVPVYRRGSGFRLPEHSLTTVKIPQKDNKSVKFHSWDEDTANRVSKGQGNMPPNASKKVERGESSTALAEQTAPEQDKAKPTNSSLPQEKKKRYRSHFSQLQLQYLESIFSRQHYLSRDERTLLAGALDMTELQVRNWFQNKRYQKRHREIQALQKLGKQVPVKVLVSEGSPVVREENTRFHTPSEITGASSG